jgi:hypothetical protein
METIPRELSEEEYEATFAPPMLNVTEGAEELVDLWPYADQVIEARYHSCTAWEWRVMSIYETRDGAYQHVNIPVPKNDTYLSIIIDKFERRIVGYRVLDLRARCPDWVKAHNN